MNFWRYAPKIHSDSYTLSNLYLISGLPGSGKTTLAKQLEKSIPALRLCPDEWVIAIMADVNDFPERDRLRDPIEAVQWDLAKRVLALGTDVILEWGFWASEERYRYRQEALALGHHVETYILVIELDELWARLEKRNAALPPGALYISKHEFDDWYDFFDPPTPEEQRYIATPPENV